jgi:hypothetical protein
MAMNQWASQLSAVGLPSTFDPSKLTSRWTLGGTLGGWDPESGVWLGNYTGPGYNGGQIDQGPNGTYTIGYSSGSDKQGYATYSLNPATGQYEVSGFQPATHASPNVIPAIEGILSAVALPLAGASGAFSGIDAASGAGAGTAAGTGSGIGSGLSGVIGPGGTYTPALDLTTSGTGLGAGSGLGAGEGFGSGLTAANYLDAPLLPASEFQLPAAAAAGAGGAAGGAAGSAAGGTPASAMTGTKAAPTGLLGTLNSALSTPVGQLASMLLPAAVSSTGLLGGNKTVGTGQPSVAAPADAGKLAAYSPSFLQVLQQIAQGAGPGSMAFAPRSVNPYVSMARPAGASGVLSGGNQMSQGGISSAMPSSPQTPQMGQSSSVAPKAGGGMPIAARPTLGASSIGYPPGFGQNFTSGSGGIGGVTATGSAPQQGINPAVSSQFTSTYGGSSAPNWQMFNPTNQPGNLAYNKAVNDYQQQLELVNRYNSQQNYLKSFPGANTSTFVSPQQYQAALAAVNAGAPKV